MQLSRRLLSACFSITQLLNYSIAQLSCCCWPHGRQAALDRSINAALREFCRHAHYILDRIRIRGAMRDDARALHSQQGCAAVFGVIEPLFEIGERAA